MMKFFDSELNVMELLWKEGDMTAKQLVEKLNRQVGWSRTTTYTIIKKLINKGAVQRSEPDFMCHALISRRESTKAEVDQLIDKMFDGSSGLLINTLLERKDLPEHLVEELRRIVKETE